MFLIKINLFCIVSGYYHTAASGPNVFTIEVNRYYLFIYFLYIYFFVCLYLLLHLGCMILYDALKV